ncbi:putative sterigmatocystin biosynthesis monooxygenase stcW [Cyphellophora attinorum]|uniref:Putative sterigmatocystin biosynthesis monooxygenase stcW n=1 Tax=Cyphellophora attinorum TaxID=1664694 RepID=A0A0N1H4D7_9EURO|nr:putative sterigmatocystin biosynthesis monooxygenase stcW [Phialophora attinorum]KPI36866.1 putative sterigmatocystin biosynthesis monooxygenase stcW [Phialophora attinorum]
MAVKIATHLDDPVKPAVSITELEVKELTMAVSQTPLSDDSTLGDSTISERSDVEDSTTDKLAQETQSAGVYGRHPIHDGSQRPLHVLIAGAGPSGLSVAMELKGLPNITFQIFEKNADVGGTWFENRYPGAACDVASHAYQWSSHSNPNWSHHFAPAEEIGEYIKTVAIKESLYEYITLKSRVVDAQWMDQRSKWVIQIEDQVSQETSFQECDLFVNAGGILNNWRWPDIPGLRSYKGELLHSASWNPQVDMRGRSVGVIGSGASSIQIVPSIQKIAESLEVFVRSPTYILPTVGFGIESSIYNECYTKSQKEQFASDAAMYRAFRKRIEQQMNENFAGQRKDSAEQDAGRRWAENVMREALASSPELQEKLIPKWELGCRRPTPGKPYLEAVQQKNVHVERVPIESICESGILTTDGKMHKLDVLVCATGFDTSFHGRYRIAGRGGRTLKELWSQSGPEAYFGLTVAGLPNYFTLLGPNCPIANGSLFPCIEATAKYIRRAIQKMQQCQIRTLEVKSGVQRQLNDYMHRVHQDLVWTGNCKSWCE